MLIPTLCSFLWLLHHKAEEVSSKIHKNVSWVFALLLPVMTIDVAPQSAKGDGGIVIFFCPLGRSDTAARSSSLIGQYQLSTDKRSGITNDPNRPDDPEYIVRLLGQVITVSLETVKVVKGLPPLTSKGADGKP